MQWNLILKDLSQQGFSVQKNSLPIELLNAFNHRIAQLYSDNQLRQAIIAQGTHTNIRGDFIAWLDPANSDLFKPYLEQLEALKAQVNQNLFLNIKEIETHVTLYPKDKHYDKHVDNYKGKNSRKLSCILYLNKDWQEGDGGNLVIYNSEDQILATVKPEVGTFVIFTSEDFPHEVTKCHRERMSITSWLRN